MLGRGPGQVTTLPRLMHSHHRHPHLHPRLCSTIKIQRSLKDRPGNCKFSKFLPNFFQFYFPAKKIPISVFFNKNVHLENVAGAPVKMTKCPCTALLLASHCKHITWRANVQYVCLSTEIQQIAVTVHFRCPTLAGL